MEDVVANPYHHLPQNILPFWRESKYEQGGADGVGLPWVWGLGGGKYLQDGY